MTETLNAARILLERELDELLLSYSREATSNRERRRLENYALSEPVENTLGALQTFVTRITGGIAEDGDEWTPAKGNRLRWPTEVTLARAVLDVSQQIYGKSSISAQFLRRLKPGF